MCGQEQDAQEGEKAKSLQENPPATSGRREKAFYNCKTFNKRKMRTATTDNAANDEEAEGEEEEGTGDQEKMGHTTRERKKKKEAKMKKKQKPR